MYVDVVDLWWWRRRINVVLYIDISIGVVGTVTSCGAIARVAGFWNHAGGE